MGKRMLGEGEFDNLKGIDYLGGNNIYYGIY